MNTPHIPTESVDARRAMQTLIAAVQQLCDDDEQLGNEGHLQRLKSRLQQIDQRRARPGVEAWRAN